MRLTPAAARVSANWSATVFMGWLLEQGLWGERPIRLRLRLSLLTSPSPPPAVFRVRTFFANTPRYKIPITSAERLSTPLHERARTARPARPPCGRAQSVDGKS